ncbi:MAG: CDP-diacylglycerol--serine O-phosphatidyltransferase [Ignavibacteriales bacterium]|nr:CDP-diacylglycerol--serine O-phosphatidyltransferase [Ignavibacteriales bacterium]
MKITRAVVPSLFTTLNAFCGFMSMMHASRGEIELGAWFIILAAIFDSLDGLMARITRSSSQFGVELDSLADVVSFGAAPSLLAFQAHLWTMDSLGILISAMPLVFGAIRLARFNVQLSGFDKDKFVGLPIPFQALTVCAFLLQYYTEGGGLQGASKHALAPLVAGLSLLMVSRVQYETLPRFTPRDLRTHPWRSIGFSAAAATIIISEGRYLLGVLLTFILFGVVRWVVQTIRGFVRHLEKNEDEESEPTSIDI